MGAPKALCPNPDPAVLVVAAGELAPKADGAAGLAPNAEVDPKAPPPAV